MKYLETSHEIAMEVNVNKTPTFVFDLDNENNLFKIGGETCGYHTKAKMGNRNGRLGWYGDDRRIRFSEGCIMVSSQFTLNDLDNMVEYAHTDTLKRDNPFVLIVKSKKGACVMLCNLNETLPLELVVNRLA